MTFSEKIKQSVSNHHLLSHPFYKDWVQGTVPKEKIKEYSKQYYHHVKSFPLYISATHSKCEDMENRRILLENLADEEALNGGDPHPELWLRFAEGLGVQREEVKKAKICKSIENVVEVFSQSANSSYEEGLASLYTYEYQVPEIAETKIKGLMEHYGVRDNRSLSFFKVHQKADVIHRKQCEKLLDQFSPQTQEPALKASKQSAQALWNFLSEMQEMEFDSSTKTLQ